MPKSLRAIVGSGWRVSFRKISRETAAGPMSERHDHRMSEVNPTPDSALRTRRKMLIGTWVLLGVVAMAPFAAGPTQRWGLALSALVAAILWAVAVVKFGMMFNPPTRRRR